VRFFSLFSIGDLSGVPFNNTLFGDFHPVKKSVGKIADAPNVR
jgi:hypothetical protein